MKVGQALGAMSDRLAVQYEISREFAQRCRDSDELGGPVAAVAALEPDDVAVLRSTNRKRSCSSS